MIKKIIETLFWHYQEKENWKMKIFSESQMLSTSVEGIFLRFLEKRYIEIPISSIQFRKLQSVKKHT